MAKDPEQRRLNFTPLQLGVPDDKLRDESCFVALFLHGPHLRMFVEIVENAKFLCVYVTFDFRLPIVYVYMCSSRGVLGVEDGAYFCVLA